jgi:Cd2+/Zn2+-exporting ATPase
VGHVDHCCDTAKSEEVNSLSPLTEGQTETILKISGADCSDEVVAIIKALSVIGISSVKVSIMASTVTARHSRDIQKEQIAKAIENTGVKVVEGVGLGFVAVNKNRILLIGLSGALLLIGFILDWMELAGSLARLVVFGLSTAAAGVLVFPKAYRGLKQRTFDITILMSVAVIGAFAIKEYSEAATVVFLFSIAELLEAFSIDRARKAIRDVLKITPQMASKKQGNSSVSVPVSEVVPGDLLVVRPGESIPLDGKVVEGNSAVNQAPVTGESRLIEKGVGDGVFAGTINENGVLTIEVTKGFEDTKIARMMKLIEEAQAQKAPSERFVDRFTKIYTPVVFALAILVALAPPLIFGQQFDLWFYRALVLLVIACPCALVLATPISVVSGLASLAKRGVLVKGGVHLESLGKIRTLAVDKTGTLTEGKFQVQGFRSFDGGNEKETLKIAASIENASSHPLAKAVLEYIRGQNIEPENVEKFKTVPGRGAEGYVGSHLYFAGNHRYAHELGVCTPEIEAYLTELEHKALSVVIVGHIPHDGHAGKVLGILSLGDSLRKNARDAIQSLHAAGVKKVVILSGDNQKTVDAIAKLAGVDEGYGELLPEDKVQKLKQLAAADKYVGMVGDGINDGPALAHAAVGISMGAAGTDAAIETSDVALMQDNLEELPKAILQGRRVLSVIRFNIGFALVTKAIFLVLAIMGISNLWLAVAADMGASIFVTANALRLLRTDQGVPT